MIPAPSHACSPHHPRRNSYIYLSGASSLSPPPFPPSPSPAAVAALSLSGAPSLSPTPTPPPVPPSPPHGPNPDPEHAVPSRPCDAAPAPPPGSLLRPISDLLICTLPVAASSSPRCPLPTAAAPTRRRSPFSWIAIPAPNFPASKANSTTAGAASFPWLQPRHSCPKPLRWRARRLRRSGATTPPPGSHWSLATQDINTRRISKFSTEN